VSKPLISRVADHCFWFGRYVERAESTARFLAVTQSLALDAELHPEDCWRSALISAGEAPAFDEKYGADAARDGDLVQRYMTWDRDSAVSIRSTIGFARENARSMREVVSIEAWETVNELYLWMESAEAANLYETSRFEHYFGVRRRTQLCLGLLRSTMLHDTALDFIWLGVMLERLGQTARFLDVHHHALSTLPPVPTSSARAVGQEVVETALWLTLLRACSGFEPFMKRYQGRVSGEAVAAFLLLEPRFPRSVRYCAHAAHERLLSIRPPEDAGFPGAAPLERARALDAWVASLDPESLLPAYVHMVLTRVVDDAALVCEGIAEEFFGRPAAV
jgi:uncharacterized alpha-E superfamily protein